MLIYGVFVVCAADTNYPYYLDRVNGAVFVNDTEDQIEEYPTLYEMSQKAVKLLSSKYSEEGFFLLV